MLLSDLRARSPAAEALPADRATPSAACRDRPASCRSNGHRWRRTCRRPACSCPIYELDLPRLKRCRRIGQRHLPLVEIGLLHAVATAIAVGELVEGRHAPA